MLDELIKNRADLWLGVEKRNVGPDVEVEVRLKAADNFILHWGVAQRRPGQWQAPPEPLWPAQTKPVGQQAVQTAFPSGDGERQIKLRFNEANAARFMVFVLFNPDKNRWDNNGGKDYWLPLVERPVAATPLAALQERIIAGEMGPHGWTLMHRFNLCHELIEEAGDARDAWATLFVWLRYSAIRQLDWQRNYNTKPKELAHSQDRLTARLATAFIQQPANRDLIRQMLAGLGRGGDGQRIRDEILQIMHRHHVKEVGGTWMEQWHQKLHNNTTPDDIVICEAYLAFLHGNGDPRCYNETLLANGVTKERLASFERPITREPEWHPHLKDGLLHDFGNYLVLLKSVHSGTDLSTAINTGGHLLDGGARDTLGWVLHNFQNPDALVTELVAKITGVRQHLHSRLNHEGNAGVVKELLYLDLALEQALRTVIERAIHHGFSGEQLLELIGRVMENLLLTFAEPLPMKPLTPALSPSEGEREMADRLQGFKARILVPGNLTPSLSPSAGEGVAKPGEGILSEFTQCQREWQRLPVENRFSTNWALHAKAALDRLRRAVEGQIDTAHQLLQPKAEGLGKSFNTDEWVVKLFSEEVVRGQSVFLLSMLIHHFDPVLRKQAKLGDWQVISPSSAVGEVLLVESLRTIQGQRFEQPTIIVAEQVYGDEEPPEGVRAVITPSSVDLVSHVAVRARNASLLFATCYDRATFEKLKATRGRVIELKVSATGDVLFAESTAKVGKTAARGDARPTSKTPAAKPSLEVLAMGDFARGRVGGKSWHLKELSAKLPDWLHTPRSVALPFGVFDAVLADKANAAEARRYRELLAVLEQRASPAAVPRIPALSPADGERAGGRGGSMPKPPEGGTPNQTLAAIRTSVRELQLPQSLHGALLTALRMGGLGGTGTHGRDARATMDTRIKQVWASKWNERAYFSRQARGFPHDAVQMAVLIQEVVEAEFAFVIHTVNPFSGNRNEIYAEAVLGLGETLVGNYPGRAMSFVCPKKGGVPTTLAYPSKSVGWFGGGLIFRSDSNAEDLEGYAGAGLYDSVLLDDPRELTLDYTGQRLVWDAAHRAEVQQKIARIGEAVENAFGVPQDIEGAFANGKFFVVQTRPQVGL